MDINFVELCQVSPSQGAAAEQSLPLLYFDIVWLPSHIMENLYFYSFQCSKSHFFETIVPSLKNSLSLTLKHFLPLAGKIVFPLSSGMPVSRYVAGEDSVSLTIALSDADFLRLTGNHSRDADDFHDYVPDMPTATISSDLIKFPVLAIQVTLFPNQGVCIGLAYHHAIGDEATMVGFLHTWASINKYKEDVHLLALGGRVLPFYDRSIAKDPCRLTPTVWDLVKMSRPAVCSTISFPTNKLRGTFILGEVEIRKLKNFALSMKPGMACLSSFAVVCGHVWSCLAKMAAVAGEEVADEEPEYLSIQADCRKWLSPPLLDTYFGNSLVLVLAESIHGRLRGNEGFVAAAQATEKAIRKTVDNDRGVLDGYVDRYLRFMKLNGKRVIRVTGSQRFDLCGIDYGWGGLKKLEALHIDYGRSVSLWKTREGVEITLSMPKVKMDAFASVFKKNMHINSNL